MTCEKRSFKTGVKEWLDYDSWEWMCDYITTMYTRTNVKRIDYVYQFTTGCTTAVVQLVVKLLVQSVVNTAGWTMQICPTKRHLIERSSQDAQQGGCRCGAFDRNFFTKNSYILYKWGDIILKDDKN